MLPLPCFLQAAARREFDGRLNEAAGDVIGITVFSRRAENGSGLDSGWVYDARNLLPETNGFPSRMYRKGCSAALLIPTRVVTRMPRAR